MRKALQGTASLVLVLLLGGCASDAPRPPATGADAAQRPSAEMKRLLEEAPVSADIGAPPPEVSEALLPPMTIALPSAEAVEPRFDINVNAAPARAFFMSLVKGTTYNVVVHPSVAGRISLTLKNVTVPEVMDMVRTVYGYEYERKSFGYIVLPRRLQSRIFYVNYLNLQRLGESKTRINSGGLSQTGRSGGSDTQSASNATTTGDDTQVETFGSRVETYSEADIWRELRAALHAIIGEGEGRSVVISPQASMVVVRAMPGELRDVEAFLEGAQDTLRRQVILEAKILEVTLSDGFQTGINWSALGQPADNKSITAGHTGGGTIFGDSGTSEIAGQTGNLDPNNYDPIDGALSSAFGGVFTLALNLNDFTAFIELLETQGDVEILSSPRVSTVNNQKALIKVGTDEFFVTDITTTTTTGTATTTSPSVTLTPFFSGIALDVTPQINAAGEVILHVHPAISDVVDQEKEITVGSLTQSVPLAFSTVRESDSIVSARSGQIVVIGGLMQELIEDEVASTPVLSDIPVLGHLFTHTRKRKRKTELVILLRPVVVDSDEVWRREIERSAERIDKLYAPAEAR